MFKLILIILFNNLFNIYGSSLNERIVGGTESTEGMFPYQISLRLFPDFHKCSGSILNENYILTTAECVFMDKVEELEVIAGSYKLISGGSRHKVAEVIIHEKFFFLNISNDIALLRLEKPLNFSDKIQPIKLPIIDTPPGVNVVMSGWGATENSHISNILLYTTLKTIDSAMCKDLLQEDDRVTEKNLCTFPKYGVGACRGDAGGPLTVNGTIVGIISWGKPCAIGFPDVHTRVFSHIDWIKDHIK